MDLAKNMAIRPQKKKACDCTFDELVYEIVRRGQDRDEFRHCSVEQNVVRLVGRKDEVVTMINVVKVRD